MVHALTVDNFFSKYIADPFSNELSGTDKLIAVVAMSVLTLITFSLIISLTSYLRNRTVTPITKDSDNDQAKKVNSQALIAIQQAIVNGKNIKTIYGELDDKTRKAVTELNLKEVNATALQLHELAEIFPCTQKLALSESSLTESHLKSLTSFKQLLALDLSVPVGSSLGLQDDSIKNLRPLFDLKMLNMNGNRGLTGTTFKLLPEALTTLFIADCRINDEGVKALSEHKLECLALDRNKDITGATFGSLNKALQTIHLTGCTALKAENLSALSCKNRTLPDHIK